MLMGWVWAPSGSYIKAHVHTLQAESITLVRGKCSIHIMGEAPVILKAGNSIIIDKGRVHNILFSENTKMMTIWKTDVGG